MQYVKIKDLTPWQRKYILPGKAVFRDSDGDWCVYLFDEQPIGFALGRPIADHRDPNGPRHVMLQLGRKPE